MDQTDRNILEYLKDDGRASYTEIADSLGVSEGTVRNRVEKMMEDGVIERFTVETRKNGISALVMVKLSTGVNMGQLSGKLPSGTDFHEVTGDYDLVLELEGEDTESLNEDIDSVRALDEVVDTKTYSVLNQGTV